MRGPHPPPRINITPPPTPIQQQQQRQQQQQLTPVGERRGHVNVVFNGNVQIVQMYQGEVPVGTPRVVPEVGRTPPRVHIEGSPIAPRVGTPGRQNLGDQLLRRVLDIGARRSLPPATPQREESPDRGQQSPVRGHMTPERIFGTPERPSPFLGSPNFTPAGSPELGVEATPRLRFTPQGSPYRSLEGTPTPEVPSTRRRDPDFEPVNRARRNLLEALNGTPRVLRNRNR